jgi:hypothetical protein
MPSGIASLEKLQAAFGELRHALDSQDASTDQRRDSGSSGRYGRCPLAWRVEDGRGAETENRGAQPDDRIGARPRKPRIR